MKVIKPSGMYAEINNNPSLPEPLFDKLIRLQMNIARLTGEKFELRLDLCFGWLSDNVWLSRRHRNKQTQRDER